MLFQCSANKALCDNIGVNGASGKACGRYQGRPPLVPEAELVPLLPPYPTPFPGKICQTWSTQTYASSLAGTGPSRLVAVARAIPGSMPEGGMDNRDGQ